MASLDLRDQYSPQPLEAALHEGSDGATLSRHSTNVSELSRILSAIRDDRDLDTVEYSDYRNRQAPEEQLVQQLDLVELRLERTDDMEADSQVTDVEKVASAADDDFPLDGKFAFWQALLAMLMVFLTWGPNAGFGVFLNYYLLLDLFPGTTMYEYALMGGMVVFLAQVLAPVTALSVRVFGQTPVHLVGIAGQTIGYFLAAECTHFWQLFICQGVVPGFFFSFMFIPGTLVIATWFDKRKATAMGLVVSGAGLGGLVFSLALNAIIERTGNQKWALRAVGIIALATSVFAATFMRPRAKKHVPYSTSLTWTFVRLSARVVFDFSVFGTYPMVVIGLWFGLCLLGYVIVLYTLASYATSVGLTHTQASNVLAVLNTMQAVGRPCMGNVGDYFGRTNTACALCLYIGTVLSALWLNAYSYATVIVLAVLVGGPVGVGSLFAQSLASDVLLYTGHQDKLPAAWGGLNIIVSLFSLPAEVIALKLKSGSGTTTYRHAQIFTACLFFGAAMLLLTNREWLVRQKFTERRAAAETQLRGHSLHLRREDLASKHEDEEDVLRMRIERYDRLLAATPWCFVIRMLYPIRV